MKFSEKAKNLRSEAGLTQQQLSKFLGITASAIGYLENGQRDPTGSTLIAYAKYFDVSIDSLVGLEPDLEDTFPYPLGKKIHSENTKTTFSERLKELREQKKLSMFSLAQQLGVSDASICKWENNDTEPKASNIRTLCEYFEVSSDYLLGLEDEIGIKKYSPPTKKPAELPPDEQRLLELFRKLSTKNKIHVLSYAQVRWEDQEESDHRRG